MNFTATIIGQILTFLVLVWFIKAFLWKPMLDMMEQRKKRIADGLESAKQGERSKQEAMSEAQGLREKARADANELIRSAERKADSILKQARDKSTVEADRILEAASQERVRQEQLMRKELQKEVSSLVLEASEKILRKEIDAKAHQSLLDNISTRI